jgi:hypothetical protein
LTGPACGAAPSAGLLGCTQARFQPPADAWLAAHNRVGWRPPPIGACTRSLRSHTPPPPAGRLRGPCPEATGAAPHINRKGATPVVPDASNGVSCTMGLHDAPGLIVAPMADQPTTLIWMGSVTSVARVHVHVVGVTAIAAGGVSRPGLRGFPMVVGRGPRPWKRGAAEGGSKGWAQGQAASNGGCPGPDEAASLARCRSGGWQMACLARA